jgi:asparagine synthase (glutamine-hydrolysing)
MKIEVTGERVYHTANICDNCLYVVKAEDKCVLCSRFDEAIAYLPEKNRLLDPVGLLSLLQFGYLCGDRTLVQGLTRLPLHSSIDSQGVITRRQQIPHSCRQILPEVAAKELLDLLTDEISEVVDGESHVAILLSGGLDSRITAGLLRKQQVKQGFDVTAITWGFKNSRDWVYSERICDIYNWQHVNIPITPSTVWQNIQRAVHRLGAEVAGPHLHAIADVPGYLPRNTLVLASSYGDSIGRSSYSGVHVKDLLPTRIHNPDGLFYHYWYTRCRNDLVVDVSTPETGGETCSRQQGYEIALQENYMRRMINEIMQLFADDFRFYQTFTSDPVVRYMWSIDPRLRGDRTYEIMIPMIDHEIARIPWQKTNQALVDDAWLPQVQCLSGFHHYPTWIHTDLREEIEPFITSNAIDVLPFINADHGRFLWKRFKRLKSSDLLVRPMSWKFVLLVQVMMLVTDYSITCDTAPFERSMYDKSVLPLILAMETSKARNRTRGLLQEIPHVGDDLYRVVRSVLHSA